MTEKKVIKYLNLVHEDFVRDIKDWSKIYFPRESKNLENKASSGRHFIEVASYIGDVLSFYIEDRAKNSNITTATDPTQVVNLAQSLGYKFRGPGAARGNQSYYIEVPAIIGGAGNYIPDMRYAVNFKNVQLQNNNGIYFESLGDVDFSEVNISSSLESVVSKRNESTGQPTHFALKRNVEVIAGKTITETIAIGSYKPFREVEISERNVLDILSVTDSDGNKWYEVDYLAQEAIFEGVKNGGTDSENVPYLLKIKTVPRRFVVEVDPKSGKTRMIFGAGKGEDVGDPIVPSVSRLALDLKGKLNFSPSTIDPQNFLKTRTLGLAPYGTSLTIKARVGGGKISNTAESSLVDVVSSNPIFSLDGLDSGEMNNTLGSFTSRNLEPIEGGDDAEDVRTIQLNASANFATQGRLNTKEDYIARSLSLPSIFGTIFRVYPVNNCNPNGGVRLYVLAKNSQGNIVPPSTQLKKNLKTYLSYFTRMGQGIDIVDGKVINIGVEYSIVVSPGLNKSKIKFDTLLKIKDYFNTDKWQLNQPILIDEIKCLIKETPGVISIPEFKIINKNNIIDGVQYSEHVYDIKSNTRNGIIFGIPQGIFEVKNPDNYDIKVAAI